MAVQNAAARTGGITMDWTVSMEGSVLRLRNNPAMGEVSEGDMLYLPLAPLPPYKAMFVPLGSSRFTGSSQWVGTFYESFRTA